ncbi:MAG: hypothetical protein GTO18_01750 [Anaerolineales bacterium]|nr:hypothetical protein [Anaerolineales bacterium]
MKIDQEVEVKRIIDAARDRGVHLRVIGGLAVKLHSPSASHRSLARTYGDIDLVGYKKQRHEIVDVLEELSYVPNVRFNTLHGFRRLLFVHPDEIFDIDVFLDVFPMCHELNFLGRLELETYTIPLPDLILSKLQVIELNEKDVRDSLAVLYDHEIGESTDREVLDIGYITSICGNDWGWYKTITTNLDTVLKFSDEYLETDEMKEITKKRLHQMLDAIEATPKSTKWKLRAKVGERVRWYELPEDMTGDVSEKGAHRGTG